MMRGLSWIIHASLCKVVFHNICLKFSLADWSRLLVDNLSRWPLQVYCWQSRVIPRKIRRSDNASLAHCTLSFSVPFMSKLGYENSPYLELLSSLNVVEYLQSSHLAVRKTKGCQNGNPLSRVMKRGLSKATCFSTVTRTNQNTGPSTFARSIFDQKQTLRLHIPLLIWLSVRQSTLTVSFQLPFLWIAHGETCKIDSSSTLRLETTAVTRTLK